jgi:nucleotide-binding universal stress UspA family protein
MCGARLDLVQVWHFPFADLAPSSGWSVRSVTTDMEAEVKREMTRLADLTTASGVPASARVAAGPSAETLIELSADNELLVMGSRGLGSVGRFMLGSVSHRVATHATVPVIIVPPEWSARTLSTVMVGVDGSTSSLEALRWAHATLPAETEIVAVRIWETYDESYGDLGKRLVTEMKAEGRHDFEQAVWDLAAELEVPHRFRTVFELGKPGVRLVEMARDSDLLVVGARGRSGLRAAVLGSTTTWIIHNINCPTAVMPQR